jgi:hypothetical protein
MEKACYTAECIYHLLHAEPVAAGSITTKFVISLSKHAVKKKQMKELSILQSKRNVAIKTRMAILSNGVSIA